MLKRDLASLYPNDRKAYTLGNVDFIQTVSSQRQEDWGDRGRKACSPPSILDLAHEFSLVGDVVDQDVLPQSVWGGYEHAPAIDAHQIVDELHHVR